MFVGSQAPRQQLFGGSIQEITARLTGQHPRLCCIEAALEGYVRPALRLQGVLIQECSSWPQLSSGPRDGRQRSIRDFRDVVSLSSFAAQSEQFAHFRFLLAPFPLLTLHVAAKFRLWALASQKRPSLLCLHPAFAAGPCRGLLGSERASGSGERLGDVAPLAMRPGRCAALLRRSRGLWPLGADDGPAGLAALQDGVAQQSAPHQGAHHRGDGRPWRPAGPERGDRGQRGGRWEEAESPHQRPPHRGSCLGRSDVLGANSALLLRLSGEEAAHERSWGGEKGHRSRNRGPTDPGPHLRYVLLALHGCVGGPLLRELQSGVGEHPQGCLGHVFDDLTDPVGRVPVPPRAVSGPVRQRRGRGLERRGVLLQAPGAGPARR
eukprot:scaffold449_cov241-Pinguiococcus_pyrenoidosus.AAC.28